MYEMIGMLTMAFLTGLTGAIPPGPTLVATVNSSLKYGWTAGPKIATGHALVESVIFLLIWEERTWQCSSIFALFTLSAAWP